MNNKGVFTVNSSPYAHEIYKHIGFVDTDTEQCINGLKFYPMKTIFQLLGNYMFFTLGDGIVKVSAYQKGDSYEKYIYKKSFFR